jgi:integrase
MVQYWYAQRPKSAEHQHPFLVFDGQDRLHLPLTTFAEEASSRLCPQTVPTYLYALMPYFTWLDTDLWQVRMGHTWDARPQQVRRSIDDYLVQKLQCQLLPQHQSWKYVALTAGTKSTLRIFLAALKLFYQLMREHQLYPFANPLVDSMSATIAAAISHVEHEEGEQNPPRMPDQSGVEAPHKKPKHRLTDSYYKLEHDEWHPQIIDDPKLPGDILRGGKTLSLKQTRLRDEVVTWLLFETGARVSEICGLMLSDLAALGTKNKAKAFSKGSYGRRIKTISFAEDTVILLQRYFDQERMHFDPHGYPLDLYLELAARHQVDLSTIPLFLSSQGTQLTPKEYREHYWNPACAAVGIDVDVHQARHWHVTREVRDIYETAKNAKEVERRLRDLIDYMKWKSDETLAAYEHYFEQQQNADTRDALQQRMHTEAQQYLEERQHGKRGKPAPHKPKHAPPALPVQQFDDEPDLNFLYSLAGEG